MQALKLPTFCYQKAFWLLFSIVIVSLGSATMAINAQIQSLDERVRNNEIIIANNDVPTLKIQIEKGFDKVNDKLDKIVENQRDIEKKTDKINADAELQKKMLCIVSNLCT